MKKTNQLTNTARKMMTLQNRQKGIKKAQAAAYIKRAAKKVKAYNPPVLTPPIPFTKKLIITTVCPYCQFNDKTEDYIPQTQVDYFATVTHSNTKVIERIRVDKKDIDETTVMATEKVMHEKLCKQHKMSMDNNQRTWEKGIEKRKTAKELQQDTIEVAQAIVNISRRKKTAENKKVVEVIKKEITKAFNLTLEDF